MSKKFVGYLRVSGRGQIDGDGFPRQREAIERFCAANGFSDLEFVQEEGISGTLDAEDRPALSRLFAMWELDRTSQPEVVIIERLDRIARALMVQECLLGSFQKKGIKVFAVDHGPIDLADGSDDPTRVLLRQFMGAIAQWEKSVFVLKSGIARAKMRAAGIKCEGAHKLGERDPKEKALVDEIISLFSMGLRPVNITFILNDKGFRRLRGKRKGEELSEPYVRGILRSRGHFGNGQWAKVMR